MHNQVMKWFSIGALLLAVLFWKSAATYQLELNLIICVAAAFVFIQAFQARKFSWAAGFLIVALLFNPLVPVFELIGGVALSIVVLSTALFATALVVLKPHRLMSMPSITDRNPGSQSL